MTAPEGATVYKHSFLTTTWNRAAGGLIQKLLQAPRTNQWANGRGICAEATVGRVCWASEVFECSFYQGTPALDNGTSLMSMCDGLITQPPAMPWFYSSQLKLIMANRANHIVHVTAYILRAKKDIDTSHSDISVVRPAYLINNPVSRPAGQQSGDQQRYDFDIRDNMDLCNYWKPKREWSEWIKPNQLVNWTIRVRRRITCNFADIQQNRIDRRYTWAILFKCHGQPIGNDAISDKVNMGPVNVGWTWVWKSGFSSSPVRNVYNRYNGNTITALDSIPNANAAAQAQPDVAIETWSQL